MPKIVYDRTNTTQDFEFVDLKSVAQVEIFIDHTEKLWINLNGKCLLRVGFVEELTLEGLLRVK